MGSWEQSDSSLTRRAVLGHTFGAAAGIATTTATAAGTQPATMPTVMTQNMYLGVGLSELFRAESMSEVRDIVGGFLAELDPSLYGARADGFAAAVESAEPDVVALQEAVTIQRQKPGDFGTFPSESATDVVVDFLERIQTALDDRGLDYAVAAETVTNEIELPADTDDGQVDVRLTDRDVLLVREDIDTRNVTTATYDTTLSVPVPGTDLTIPVSRGYCMADATVGDVDLTVVSTHLESSSSSVRRQQAEELVDALPTDRPVVVGGDFNSAPGEDAYGLLTDSLTDAYSELQPDSEGYTCCQAADLRNDQSQLRRRIDGVLYRGALRPASVDRVGDGPDDRAVVDTGGETIRVWPSDHAGVVATFEPLGTAVTPTPVNRTVSDGTDRTGTATSGSGPGLGVVAALAGLFAGALAQRHRSE